MELEIYCKPSVLSDLLKVMAFTPGVITEQCVYHDARMAYAVYGKCDNDDVLRIMCTYLANTVAGFNEYFSIRKDGIRVDFHGLQKS